MINNVFITASDIMILKEVSYKTACKILNKIIKKYDLPKERDISLKSFCDHYHTHEEQMIRILNNHYQKKTS